MARDLPIIRVNGEIDGLISPLDRGFNYGDGVFETCRVVNGRIPLWQFHKARLIRSLDALKIAVDIETLERDIYNSLLNDIGQAAHALVKVQVTRGVGGRGYKPTSVTPTQVIGLYAAESWQSLQALQGIQARICEFRLSKSTALSGIKHMNRLEQVLARSEWDDEFHEGILCDVDDNVIEGTFSNIFLVKNGELRTPRLEYSGVAGVMRQIICEIIAPKLDIPVCVTPLTLMDFKEADEVFFCNSVMGIWPVTTIEHLGEYSQRKITKWLQHDIHRLFEGTLDY
jgi:4-amino-4-deoxychorismate lyase